MKNRIGTIAAIVIILLLSGIVASLLYFKKENKAVYILTDKVFENYEGTKELAQKVKALESRQKGQLDSLYQQILLAEKEGKAGKDKLDKAKLAYEKMYSGFVKSNQEKNLEYKDAIWKQINKHMMEYGKSKGYAFIYGAAGTGNIMYADSTLNVTDEVLIYLNKKYSGE